MFILRVQIKQTWKESPIEKGLFDYNEFVSKIKGKQDEEEMAAA